MAIKVRLKTLKNGHEEIIHPETDWSIVQNRPSITVGSNGQTWSNGSSIRLDGNRIYVKDYLRSEVLLENYPINVKWSAVQNRPSITVGENTETWSRSGSSIRLGANNIYVKDSKRNYEVLLEDYPIKWSAISGYGKPDYLPSNQNLTTFGRYEEKKGSETQTIRVSHPAVRRCIYQIYGGVQNYSYIYYYLNCTDADGNPLENPSWKKFDGNGFIPGL